MSVEEAAKAWCDAASLAERTQRDEDWVCADAAFRIYQRARKEETDAR